MMLGQVVKGHYQSPLILNKAPNRTLNEADMTLGKSTYGVLGRSHMRFRMEHWMSHI